MDVDNQTEVFRVPQHNDVDAMEMMNDFREVGLVNFKKNYSTSLSQFLSISIHFYISLDSHRRIRVCISHQSDCRVKVCISRQSYHSI